jgi:hypothetical protein
MWGIFGSRAQSTRASSESPRKTQPLSSSRDEEDASSDLEQRIIRSAGQPTQAALKANQSRTHAQQRRTNSFSDKLPILLLIFFFASTSFFSVDLKSCKELMYESSSENPIETLQLLTDDIFYADDEATKALVELVGGPTDSLSCPEGQWPIQDTVLPSRITSEGRKIPKIIHMTGRSRCTTEVMYDTINLWRLQNHSLFFHDDEAMDRLLSNHWPKFRRADLWRYLITWEL